MSSLKKCNERTYPNKRLWILVICGILVTILLPFVLSYIYMRGSSLLVPNTIFTAPDLLQYIGSIFVLCGTVVLGVITLLLSKKANYINERLCSLEERSQLPLLRIEKLLAVSDKFSADEVRFIYNDFAGLKTEVPFFLLYFEIQNISDLDISNITPLYIRIDDYIVTNFRTVNALLNRQEKKRTLAYINIPAPVLNDDTSTIVVIEFRFQVTDYFSNNYIQSITIKSVLVEVKTEAHNQTRVHAILNYCSTKPSSITENE